ncbi:probable ubiquinone biosynthesis O-methyltransferase at C-terminar half [Coccomyxa sp. Obi]|nr:probable ubiquinone biosynthesis O-methyltransferase at C-terminar half [Coccomyxa sp. Obi]
MCRRPVTSEQTIVSSRRHLATSQFFIRRKSRSARNSTIAASSASEVLSQIADGALAIPPSAFGAIGALGLIGAALFVADPEKRRSAQTSTAGGDEKEAVKGYFNTVGFERWNKIYGTTDEISSVQMDIREGHAVTVDKVLNWLAEEGGVKGVSVCDAGCGTGSLSIPLALQGAKVYGSDISEAMANEAARRYEAEAKAASVAETPKFEAKDLESISGTFHTVCCIDVLIHYPPERMAEMVGHLASLAEQRLILSFAPSTPYYEVLKRIGEFFPKGSKATRAYLHKEEDVEAALVKAGYRVTKREMTASKFYFSRLFEAVPAS